jgi:hypothetical protein
MDTCASSRAVRLTASGSRVDTEPGERQSQVASKFTDVDDHDDSATSTFSA